MIGADDDMLVPDVQPKGFTPAIVTPTGGSMGVHFSEDTDEPSSSANNAKSSTARSKSKSLGLSLRRITPDMKSSGRGGGGNGNAQQSVSSPRGESSNHHLDDGRSFVSRITGKSGKSRGSSIFTGATPKIRNHKSSTASAAAAASTSSVRSPKKSNVVATNSSSSNNINIERKQKMNDEYYRPTMRWADDDEFDEEVMEDGDLPSLRRVNSAGSRGGNAAQWRAANRRNMQANNSANNGNGGYGNGGYGNSRYEQDEYDERDQGVETSLFQNPITKQKSPLSA
mmetsp:Transcript_46020/g.96623  ORF Transcript_46020/g.96623 Transcript_46020/m.96623 type:complete len:284 (-) Transcript_46020:191-1042(-)